MSKREFLLLSHVRKPGRDWVGGWMMSEKLDGYRAFWDSGISRGIPCSDIPWANTTKHARLKTAPMGTGLWTRLGQPIPAPKYFLDTLPSIPLDGELTMGRGTHQSLASVVKTTTEEHEDWDQVKYAVFDSPCLATVFADGSLNGRFYKKKLSGIESWVKERDFGLWTYNYEMPFYTVYAKLKAMDLGQFAYLLDQQILSSNRIDAEREVAAYLRLVESEGGEGVMLRNPISFWQPERSHSLLKVKSYLDDEGIVISYTWASGTDLDKSLTGVETNKLVGLMGSLRVRMRSGVEFDLSGFTDDERVMHNEHMSPHFVREYGAERQGQKIDSWFVNPKFIPGSTVTFKYRELTKDGRPKEAKYWRKTHE